jgi:hypothetical protein
MSKLLQKVIKNRGQKVAVKKTVTRGGKTFQQTFWVSPQEAAALQKQQQAAPEVEKPTKKALLQATHTKGRKAKRELDHSIVRQSIAKGDFDTSRKALERSFSVEGLAKAEFEEVKPVKVEDMPLGLYGSHDQSTGEITLSTQAAAGAKHFLAEFERYGGDWKADMAEWSARIEEYDQFRKKNSGQVEGTDGKMRPKWAELERQSRVAAGKFPLDEAPPFDFSERELPKVEMNIASEPGEKRVALDFSVDKHLLMAWETDDSVDIDYLGLESKPGEAVPSDYPLALYKEVVDYAIAKGKKVRLEPTVRLDDYTMNFWRALKAQGYDVKLDTSTAFDGEHWKAPRREGKLVSPITISPTKPTAESRAEAEKMRNRGVQMVRGVARRNDPAHRKKFGLPEKPRPSFQDPVRQMMLASEMYGTVVHEVLHGFGPCDPNQYKKEGAVVEEITTELLTRRHLREHFGFSPTAVAQTDHGAYNDYIVPFRELLEYHYNATPGEAQLMMEDAALAYKKKKRAPGSTAHRALIADFVKEFNAPTGKPDWDEPKSGGWTALHDKLRESVENVTPRLFVGLG